MESKLQSKIIRFLKDHGAYVIKTRPGPGTPIGCPDVIALYEDRWLVIEVKASSTAKFQRGQQETLLRLKNTNPYVYMAYPEVWDFLAEELIANFF